MAPMCWRNVIATAALDTGPVQLAGLSSTRSGSGSANDAVHQVARAPTRVSAASPAVLITVAVVDRRVLAVDAGREGAEGRRRAHRQRQRGGDGAAGAAGRLGRVLAGELGARREDLRRGRGDASRRCRGRVPGASTTGSRSWRSVTRDRLLRRGGRRRAQVLRVLRRAARA